MNRHSLAIGLLAARILRLDNHHAVLGDALVAQAQQALLVKVRQGGGPDIKAQVDGGRHLVDVLATGPLGAYGRELDLVEGDAHGIADS